MNSIKFLVISILLFYKQGFWYFAGKKAKFSGIFRGKFAEKSADFRGNRFRGRKVKICRKIGRFRGILAEKSQFSKDFQGQILRKIGRFHGKFRGGNFAKKQSVKNSRFRWIFLANFAKIDQFSVDMTSVERFFNRDNHLLFQQQFAREMREC